jgi:hypothetical protein
MCSTSTCQLCFRTSTLFCLACFSVIRAGTRAVRVVRVHIIFLPPTTTRACQGGSWRWQIRHGSYTFCHMCVTKLGQTLTTYGIGEREDPVVERAYSEKPNQIVTWGRKSSKGCCTTPFTLFVFFSIPGHKIRIKYGCLLLKRLFFYFLEYRLQIVHQSLIENSHFRTKQGLIILKKHAIPNF